MKSRADSAQRCVWLARHADRQDFADPRWAATADRPFDPPLSALGRRQALALARRLAREPLAHLFSSPFLRCAETASPIADALELAIALDDGLSEWLNREWFPERPVLLGPAAAARRFARIDRLYRSRGSAQYGESGEAALQRAGLLARHLVSEFSGDLLLVGHGASVLGAAAALLGTRIGPAGGPLPSELPTASLTKLVQQPDTTWRLVLRADTSHLG
jgi:broad specificity phosphatase PhoE